MKCPKCGEEMDNIGEEMSFIEEDKIEVETIYYCENCEKSFKFSEKFKKISSEFVCEVED